MSINPKPLPAASSEPILHCPNCRQEIRLTESLAGPLLEQTRTRYETLLAEKDSEIERKADTLRHEREEVARSRAGIEDEIARRLAVERPDVVASEARKARAVASAELAAKEQEAIELRTALAFNNE